LSVTKSFLTKSRARAFESIAAKLAYLGNVADYDLPLDYPRREQAIVDGMTVEQVKAIAGQRLRPDTMTYVVVGDAATQAKRVEQLGFGPAVLINDQLERVQE
jgi:zinc protease